MCISSDWNFRKYNNETCELITQNPEIKKKMGEKLCEFAEANAKADNISSQKYRNIDEGYNFLWEILYWDLVHAVDYDGHHEAPKVVSVQLTT